MSDELNNPLGPKLQSRKWWAFVGAFLIATLLLFLDKISGDIWGDSVFLFYGTYVTGNVIEKRRV